MPNGSRAGEPNPHSGRRKSRPAARGGRPLGSAVTPFEIGDPPEPVGKSQPLAFHSQIEIAIRRTPQWNAPVFILSSEAAPRAARILDLLDGKKEADGRRAGGIKSDQQSRLAED